MAERHMQTKLVRSLEDGGAVILNIHGHAFQRRGWPDLYVGSSLWQGWLELKWRARPVTPLQKQKLEDLMDRDVWAFVLRFNETGIAILQGVTTQSSKFTKTIWTFAEHEWRDGRGFLKTMGALCCKDACHGL